MKAPVLKNCSGLDLDWATVASQSIYQPEIYLEKLCDMSSKNQWDLAEMDWDKIDFSALPQSVRQGLVNIFTQIHYGEVTALVGASALVEHAPTTNVRSFATFQAADEARHVKWFSMLIKKLDCRAKVLPTVALLMKDINSGETLEEKTLGMHLLVESMAHTIFSECSKAVKDLSFFERNISPVRKLIPVFGEWLPDYLMKDEELHLNFGVYFLHERLKNMPFKKRHELEEKVTHWGALFLQVVDDPSILAMPGMDSKAIGIRCIEDINARLASVGLESRIPSLKSLDKLLSPHSSTAH